MAGLTWRPQRAASALRDRDRLRKLALHRGTGTAEPVRHCMTEVFCNSTHWRHCLAAWYDVLS